MNTRSRLTLPPLSVGPPQDGGHDLRLRMEIERTRLGRNLIEQRLYTLELRQAPMKLGGQGFRARQKFLRLLDLAVVIVQGLRGVMHMFHHAEHGF